MKRLLLIIFFGAWISQSAFSQYPQLQPAGTQKAGGKLYGKVVDSATNRGIEAASVQLFYLDTDSIAGGMLTKPNGDFSIFDLPLRDTFSLVITAIGYGRKEFVVSLAGANGMMGQVEKDFGNITLSPDAQYLGQVTVVGEKPALTMGIDRKIFDVDKSITSAGGTAIDVMRNIPSVSVDVDGNVTLRNSPPQIFVDGRPTILTLDQIPADHIDRIEMITNPSAKFDASSVGGIINVVLKKDKRLGLNGMVSAGVGSPGILNGNLAINLREGKFNFFVNGGYNESGGRTTEETYRVNRDKGVPQDYFRQKSENERGRRFTSIRFGMDYFLDNRNTLSISQNFVQGRFSGNEEQRQDYYNLSNNLVRYGERTSDSRFRFDRSNTRLSFKHNFVEQGKEITADVNYNSGSGKNNSLISNYYYNLDGTEYSPTNIVRNDGWNDNDEITMQVDFVDPRGEDGKLEAGVRTYINDFTSVFNAFSIANGGEVKLPLSNNYKYREMVNAAYFTYSGKLLGIRYQAGLRTEHSKFTGELVDSSRKFGYEYPRDIDNIFDALFPSLFLTKDLGNGNEIQLNYSRRIRRPNFWQLNPFVDINDPFNIRRGNPELRPEFTNSFEFNYQNTYNTGSFLGVIYSRYTDDDITQYSDTISDAQYQQLNNAAVDPNAILNTYINANSQVRLGAEFTLQQKIGRAFDFTPTIDLQYRKVNASVNSLDLSNDGFNWEAKLIMNYRLMSQAKFWDKWSFQLTGEYESPEIIPQGKRSEQYVADFGLKKDFLKNNKATVTFNVNDIFNSRRWGTIYDTEDFYQDSYRRRSVRSFRISFTYKFGDANFSLFRRNGNNRGNDRDDDDDGGGYGGVQ